MMTDLFPETATSASEPATVEWHGKLLDKWAVHARRFA